MKTQDKTYLLKNLLRMKCIKYRTVYSFQVNINFYTLIRQTKYKYPHLLKPSYIFIIRQNYEKKGFF